MKNNFLTFFLILLLIGVCIFVITIFFRKTDSPNLIKPQLEKVSKIVGLPKITPSATPTPTPISYNFNKSTDLKKELESVNPQMLDIDFSSLQPIISQF